MHALSARPLKVRELTDLRSERGRRRRDRVSGREFSLCADGTMRKTFIVAVSPPNRLAVHGGKIRKDVAKNADLC